MFAALQFPLALNTYPARKCFSFAEKHKLLEGARCQRDILAAARLFPGEKIYCFDY
jgi:hypothetical protein